MVNSSTPNAEFSNKDFYAVLIGYIGTSPHNAWLARERFDCMFAKIAGIPLVSEPSKPWIKELDESEPRLAERLQLEEVRTPDLEAYLEKMESLGDEVMRIAIFGNCRHYDLDPSSFASRTRFSEMIRSFNAGYFGRKLFATMILSRKDESWQQDVEEGRYNPIRNMPDFMRAQQKLSEYRTELSRLVAESSVR